MCVLPIRTMNVTRSFKPNRDFEFAELDFEQHFPSNVDWDQIWMANDRPCQTDDEWIRLARLSQRKLSSLSPLPDKRRDELRKKSIQSRSSLSRPSSIVKPSVACGSSLDRYSDLSVSTNNEDVERCTMGHNNTLVDVSLVDTRTPSWDPKTSKLFAGEVGIEGLASDEMIMQSIGTGLERERKRPDRFDCEALAIPIGHVDEDQRRQIEEEEKQHRRRTFCIWTFVAVVVICIIAGATVFVFTSGLMDFLLPQTSPPPSVAGGAIVPSPAPAVWRPTIGTPTTPASGVNVEDATLPDGTTWTYVAPLVPGELVGDNFGQSIALSSDGKIMACGADQNAPDARAGDSRGYVQVFESTPSVKREIEWSQLGQTIVGDSDWDQTGFSVSLSNDGTILAVGAPGSLEQGFYTGGAKVFQLDSQTRSWVQLGDTLIGDSAYDHFGFSVSLAGDGYTLAVGARTDTVGYVRVFRYSESLTKWIRKGDTISGDVGGCTVGEVNLAGNGERLVCRNAGDVRAFEYSDYYWKQVGRDIRLGVRNDQAGKIFSLSKDGNSIVTVDGQGRLRVFRFDSSRVAWRQRGRALLTARNPRNAVASVAINENGSVVAMGLHSYEEETRVNNNRIFVRAPGKAIAFGFGGLYWDQLGSTIFGGSENEGLGNTVALNDDGGLLAIGALDANAGHSGFVEVFSFM